MGIVNMSPAVLEDENLRRHTLVPETLGTVTKYILRGGGR